MSAWIDATPAPPDLCREKAFVEKGMKGLGLETSGAGLNEPGEEMVFFIGTQPKNPERVFLLFKVFDGLDDLIFKNRDPLSRVLRDPKRQGA